MNKKMIGASIGILALAVAGCTTTGNDAGIQHRVHGKRLVVDMPDGYPNIAAACVRGNLVFVTSGDQHGAPTVLPNAPACDGIADGEIGEAGSR